MITRADKTRGNFSQILNDTLRDKKLSFNARGLLGFMLTYPNDWDFSIKFLIEETAQKPATVKSAMKELEECGYVMKSKVKNGTGRFVGWAYAICETNDTTKWAKFTV